MGAEMIFFFPFFSKTVYDFPIFNLCVNMDIDIYRLDNRYKIHKCMWLYYSFKSHNYLVQVQWELKILAIS